MYLIDIGNIPTPQLRGILSILKNGAIATSSTSTSTEIKEVQAKEEEEIKEPNSGAEAIVPTKSGESMENLEIKDLQGKLELANKDLEAKIKEVEILTSSKDKLEVKVAEQDELITEFNALKTEFTTLKEEVESLRAYKTDKEEAERRATVLSDRKEKVKAAELELDLDSEADKWIDMSDEIFDFTLSNLAKVKTKFSQATASSIKVPDVSNSDTKINAIDIVRQGLKEAK